MTFSKTVTGVAANDFTATLSGVTAGTLVVPAISGTVYDVTVPSISGNGKVRLDIRNTATISDALGNAYNSNFTTGQVYTVDTILPTVVSSNYQSPATSPTNATSLIFRVTFSENVTGVATTDFTTTLSGVTTGAPTVSPVSGTVYDVTVPSVSGSGTVRLDIPNTATITDAVGNAYNSNFTTGQVYTVDQALPTFTAIAPASNSTMSDTKVSYTLSENIVSGTITWTRTGGTADANTHIQTLTGTELNSGVHTEITLTNDPTLVVGAIYTVVFAGTDAVGNFGSTTSTSVTYTPTAIANSDIVATSGFVYTQNID